MRINISLPVQVNPSQHCLESVRKRMELQTLHEVKTTGGGGGLTVRKPPSKLRLHEESSVEKEEEDKKYSIPAGTRLAFSVYNGAWPLGFEDIKDRVMLNPLFECNDADKGEFYLFYKRVSVY